MLPILLIDDNLPFCNRMAAEGGNFGLEIMHRQSLEEGMELLREDPRILALILDTRCRVDDDDPHAGSNFILHAVRNLHDFEHEMDRILPFCFCSENPAEFTEDMAGFAKVFDKNNPPQPLFDHVKGLIAGLPRFRIKEKHREVFRVFDRFFSAEDEEVLTTLALNLDKDDPASVISNLGMLRRLEESLMDLAAVKLLPSAEVSRPHSLGHARAVMMHLHQTRKLDGTRYAMADKIYKICSRYGNHTLKNKGKTVEELPSSLMVNGLFYLFSDIANNLSKHF